MRGFGKVVATSVLSMLLSTGIAYAGQDHDRDHDRGMHDRDGRDMNDRGMHDRDDRNMHDRGMHDRGMHEGHRRHDEWRRGGRIRHEDWDRGSRIDYRRYRLRRPPRGYEWRDVDGYYVLASPASGAIISVQIGGR